MWIKREPLPKYSMRKADQKKNRLLRTLADYIIGHDKDITSILLHLWRDQMIVTGYKQIREWVNRRNVTDEDMKDFRGDYERLAHTQMEPIWERTMNDAVSPDNPQFDWAKRFTREAQNTAETPSGGSGGGTGNGISPFFPRSFDYHPQQDGVRNWVQNHTAELVTNATNEQKKAIQSVIAYGTEHKFSTDELARRIRPTIGLNARQAAANTKYYNRVKDQLTKDHPRMKPENIEKRAQKQADIYAKQQKNYRARMIARTEIGNAYNAGALYGVKKAIDDGLIASATKVWVTSRAEMAGKRPCDGCHALEGVEIPIDGYFNYNGTLILAPLAHPNGKCTLEFKVEEPDFHILDNAFLEDSEIIDSEEIETGGHHYKPKETDNKNDVKAKAAYEKFTKEYDADIIAKNTGFSEEEIVQVRRHVFYDKHKLYESYDRFEPDYSMAVAWKRLKNNTFLPRDITLLRHELLESQLEKEYNLTASDAHDMAVEVYDWWGQLQAEGGEKDDLL